jgi:hypothetical protein
MIEMLATFFPLECADGLHLSSIKPMFAAKIHQKMANIALKRDAPQAARPLALR